MYSLGCTLYYLLTGQPPFPGGSPIDKMMRHFTEEPQSVTQLQPAVPLPLAALLRKMMAKRADDRFQSAAEVAAALAPWSAADPGEEALPPASGTHGGSGTGALSLSQPLLGFWRTAILLAGASALGLLLLMRPWGWLGRPETPAAPAAREPAPFVTNSIHMKLALIRPGSFEMGALPAEEGWAPERGRAAKS